ncbi:alpha/beta hydrolase family protein [Crocinitomix catalasitica]|uniref:alpha/beta hydrolase family protein n=1 Tax=Crocinitomix catalasitica TaxID=184607 RepID=UPI000481C5B0|nr:prolyl oligopeptidase family serine peptidase [Crocinitomix catalasitica]
MSKHIRLSLTFFLFHLISFSQNKIPIDAKAYDEWKAIENVHQSKSGLTITYEINPQEGDGYLFVKNPLQNDSIVISRGKNAAIHYQDKFVVGIIQPQHDTVRKLKLADTKKDKLPKDSLFIYLTNKDTLLTFEEIKSFKIAPEGDWIAYLSENDNQPQCKKKKCTLFKKNKCEEQSTSGTTLTLFNPINNVSHTIHYVKDYAVDKFGKNLVYTSSNKGETDTLSVYRIDLNTLQETKLQDHQLEVKNIIFDKAGNYFAYIFSADTNKIKNYALNIFNVTSQLPFASIDTLSKNMPDSSAVSSNFKPYFSDDSKKLFFGTASINRPEPEDTLLDTEKAVVDIWGPSDLRIQPQQLNEKRKDEKNSNLALYHLQEQKITPIGIDLFERISVSSKPAINYALAYASNKYKKEATWDFPWKNDVYRVDLLTGDTLLLKEGIAYSNALSPNGDVFIYYNGIDSSWYSYLIEKEITINLTKKLGDLFASDNNGNPFITFSNRGSGWTKINNEVYYLVNAEYDIWALHPSEPNKTFCITNGIGKDQKMIYRYQRFDYDSTYTNIETGLIKSTNDDTKQEGYSKIQLNANGPILTQLIESPHRYTYISKADDTDNILFRRMSFETYPELEITDLNFKEIKTITSTNPQQKNYNWGTVEPVKWTSYKGLELDGLLYRPEDFDSTKKYPMIVYFYEKYSDNIHFYYTPKPTASIIYPTEYVSNQYIVFIPDILYEPGHPAKSAFDCIVSGTDYLLDKYEWIDSNKLGLQGQSWGGYQTAQLITMTDKYHAAMAGAPVSNMFSAYGGIRWGSGLSRMFQYEKTQSRIGFTIWERPDLYIENSPLFGLPNVKTPLLIMHNDGDGAVPWYQGIELYMGLRRLDQPVWLLNYNGDEHNLMKTANRKDLSVRMKQFFDFYLQDKEMPIWMKDGVPAIEKGRNNGLSY